VISDLPRAGLRPLPEDKPEEVSGARQTEGTRELFGRRGLGVFLAPFDEGDVRGAQAGELAQPALSEPGGLACPPETLCVQLHVYQRTPEDQRTQREFHAQYAEALKSESMSLLERMQECLDTHGWTAREWARRAGLREPTHVSTIMRRLREGDSDRLVGDIETFAKLAEAAGWSLDYLILGRGSPHALTVEVRDDPRYPSRARVLVAAHWLGFSEAAIRALLEHNPESDPGTDYWLRVLQTEQLKLPPAAPKKARK
jgi:alkanesulfonate monooxygenase SsuD/methylene tetrahydromethanopterin reductase-like flavin-dependent oxidoreductase (luciferase family)